MGRNNQQRRAAKARVRAKAAARARAGASFGGGFQGGGFGGGAASARGGAFGGSPFDDWLAFGAASAYDDEFDVEEEFEEAGGLGLLDRAGRWMVRAGDELEAGRDVSARAASDMIIIECATAADRREVSTWVTDLMRGLIEAMWRGGWTPMDLHRIAGRKLDATAQVVLADLIAHALSRYAAATLAPSWRGHLAEIHAEVWWGPGVDPIEARSRHLSDGLGGAMWQAARLMHLLQTLPALSCLDPLPGTARPQRRAPTGPDVDERILGRVRAMLAKAESTMFEAEAETFTAAAQALMARHSIDAAMLAQTGPEGGTSAEAPLARRIWIDNPYEAPKVMLLDVVATANRCRAVWSNHLGFVTVVGHAGDLAATETIFTSLLVQATAAMRGHGSRTTRDGRSRTTAFRRTFLGSYAQRIGERLQEVTDAETAEAVSRADAAARAADDRVDAPVGAAAPTSGRELVRVLTVRADAVDHRVEELFPDMTFRTVARPSDHEGWSAGRRAADQASLFAPERVVGG